MAFRNQDLQSPQGELPLRATYIHKDDCQQRIFLHELRQNPARGSLGNLPLCEKVVKGKIAATEEVGVEVKAERKIRKFYLSPRPY